MTAVDLLAEVLSTECIHGLTKRTCSICLERIGWGKLGQKTYRKHLADEFPERFADLETPVKYCDQCPRRGACKGHRVNVRVPRGRVSFGIGAPIHPPSWQGELLERPKLNKATHRHGGRWLCDRCHDRGMPAERDEKVKVKAITLHRGDVFAR